MQHLYESYQQPKSASQIGGGPMGAMVGEHQRQERLEVPDAIEHLRRRISYLEEQASELAKRLAPVLVVRPEQPPGQTGATAQHSAALAAVIDEEAHRVERVCASLERLTRDLAI